MDPITVRLICAGLAVAFGVLIFFRRRGRDTE